MPEKQSNEMTEIHRTVLVHLVVLGAKGSFCLGQRRRKTLEGRLPSVLTKSLKFGLAHASLTVAVIVLRSATKSFFWWALWAIMDAHQRLPGHGSGCWVPFYHLLYLLICAMGLFRPWVLLQFAGEMLVLKDFTCWKLESMLCPSFSSQTLLSR